MSHSKHPPVWFPAPSTYMYKHIRERENDGSGEIRLGTGVVHYFGTGPKAFIIVAQCLGKGPGDIISFAIPHFCNSKYLILVSFYGSHTTIANTINVHGELSASRKPKLMWHTEKNWYSVYRISLTFYAAHGMTALITLAIIESLNRSNQLTQKGLKGPFMFLTVISISS